MCLQSHLLISDRSVRFKLVNFVDALVLSFDLLSKVSQLRIVSFKNLLLPPLLLSRDVDLTKLERLGNL